MRGNGACRTPRRPDRLSPLPALFRLGRLGLPLPESIPRMKITGFIPYDPVEKKPFVNAVADSPTEAAVNLSQIDLSDEVVARITYIPASIDFEPPGAEPAQDAPLTEADIGAALTGLLLSFEAEYRQMTKEDLEARWRFTFDPAKSLEANMYLFHDRLALYAGSCRRWEDMHNGRSCVVERVRDTYLRPKIQEFADQVRAYLAAKPNPQEETPGA